MKYQQICSYVINDNLSQHFPLNAKSIDRKVNLTPVHVKYICRFTLQKWIYALRIDASNRENEFATLVVGDRC